MYFSVKYQPVSPYYERSIDLSVIKPIPTTPTSPPSSAFTFTCYPTPIPRLPFSVLPGPPPDEPVMRRRRRKTFPPSLLTAQPIADNYKAVFGSSYTSYTPIIATTARKEANPKEQPEAVRESKLTTKKKYKPVALKVKPVLGELPEKFRIIRNIVGDPLEHMPVLTPNPPPFVPTGRYTLERKAIFDEMNPGFLLPAERDLIHHFMTLHQDAFAWDDSERGHFREDFFPPVEMPVIPHTPWVL
jgi:hypothetical protein